MHENMKKEALKKAAEENFLFSSFSPFSSRYYLCCMLTSFDDIKQRDDDDIDAFYRSHLEKKERKWVAVVRLSGYMHARFFCVSYAAWVFASLCNQIRRRES